MFVTTHVSVKETESSDNIYDRCSILLVVGDKGSKDGPAFNRTVDAFGLEIGAFVLAGGLRVGFNLAEFGDFLTGIVGIDLLSDDDRRPPAPNPEDSTTDSRVKTRRRAGGE